MPVGRIASYIRIRLILLQIVASHGIIIVYRCPKQKGKQKKNKKQKQKQGIKEKSLHNRFPPEL